MAKLRKRPRSRKQRMRDAQPYRRRTDRAPRCGRCGRCHKRFTEAQCFRRPKRRKRGPSPRVRRVNELGQKVYAPYGYLTTIQRFGHLLTWSEMTGKEQYVTSLRIKGAYNRNKYWRDLGYPNLVNARAALVKYREERLREGLLPAEKARRLERVVSHEAEPRSADETRAAQIYEEGRLERARVRDGSRPLLGGLLVAGNYDPEYLMRREMRILDVMSRCAQ